MTTAIDENFHYKPHINFNPYYFIPFVTSFRYINNEIYFIVEHFGDRKPEIPVLEIWFI